MHLVLFFIAIPIVAVTIIDWRLRNHSYGLQWGFVDPSPSKVRRFKSNILDRVWRDLARVRSQNDEVCQLTGRDRAFGLLLERRIPSFVLRKDR